MNDHSLVSRFAENCTRQNIRYIEDLNSAHTHSHYWTINFIIQMSMLMMSVKHSHQNSKPPTTATLKHTHTPSLVLSSISSITGSCDHSICPHHHFLFSCRVHTDVSSFPFLNPSISHTASAPRDENKEKKASTSRWLWWNFDFSNSVALQSSHQFWKGHYFPFGHKLDEKLRDLLSSGIDFS